MLVLIKREITQTFQLNIREKLVDRCKNLSWILFGVEKCHILFYRFLPNTKHFIETILIVSIWSYLDCKQVEVDSSGCNSPGK